MVPKQDGTHNHDHYRGWYWRRRGTSILLCLARGGARRRSHGARTWCRISKKPKWPLTEIIFNISNTNMQIFQWRFISLSKGSKHFAVLGPRGASRRSQGARIWCRISRKTIWPLTEIIFNVSSKNIRIFQWRFLFCRRGPSILLCFAHWGHVGGVKAQELDVASAKTNLTPNRNQFSIFRAAFTCKYFNEGFFFLEGVQ